MRKISLIAGCVFFFSGCFCFSQTSGVVKADPTREAERALDLVKTGRCREALPLLRKATAPTTQAAKELKKQAGFAGVRCAMGEANAETATEFLRGLSRDFPRDPEVLFLSVHTYSDLSSLSAQQLATSAPDSAQAHELNAEALEMQGKWNEAEKEYRTILQKDPHAQGIHFLLGRLMLSRPNPPFDMAERAKQEFQKELEIDPNNAGAEYVLGEIARQAQQWDEAIQHFTKSSKLDRGFGDAYLGLGMSLISQKKFGEAVAPLETAVKLESANPTAHYNLAIAYSRSGRKEESEKEFAIHRQMVQKVDPAGTTPAAQPQDSPQ